MSLQEDIPDVDGPCAGRVVARLDAAHLKDAAYPACGEESAQMLTPLPNGHGDWRIYRLSNPAGDDDFFTLSFDPMAIMADDGTFLRVNPAWEQALGYSETELRAANLARLLDPADVALFLADLQRAAAGKSVVNAERRFLDKDGSVIYARVRLNASATPGAVSVVVRDVTEPTATADALRKCRAEAEAASAAKCAFLANMSHEIRTPLNGICGMTDLVLDSALSDDQRENLEIVKASANALLGLVNDVLDFSKIQAHKLVLAEEEFDVRKCVAAAVRAYAVRAFEKRLELLFIIEPEVPYVAVGDFRRLRQILNNLIDNALKFTQHGEVVVRVGRQSSTADRVALTFSVSDTGIGICDGKQQEIFEPFAQADTSSTRRHGGIGLGLTIASELAGMMGGRIRLESEPGKGSTFHATVSLGLPDDRGAASPKPARLLPQGLPALVVDDNETSKRHLEKILSRAGAKPTSHEWGGSVLSLLRSSADSGRAIPLVILDHQMPGVDGLTLARAIRQSPQLSQTAVILMASGNQSEIAERCREVGITCLSKPLSEEDLLDSILPFIRRFPDAPKPVDTPASPASPKERPLRFLVAEDNPINRLVAMRLIERQGHIARAVENGQEALRALEIDTFDCILMDLQMPKMDGFEATATIREQERRTGEHLPIVAMTAHVAAEDRDRCLAAGMDDYVAKPISAKDLFVAVDRALTKRHSAPGIAFPAEESLPR